MARKSAFRNTEQHEETLSEREQKLIERLLSEPANFPAQFKTWVRAWVGEDPPPATWETIIGAPDKASLGGGPVGAIYLWPLANPPRNHLALDGANVSRVTYKAIFEIFGVAFGSGDGTTTFGLPDTRDRVAVGKGVHADTNAIGANEGVVVGSRSIKHQHTGATDASDSHDHGGTDDESGHTHEYQYPNQLTITEGTAGASINVAPAFGAPATSSGGSGHSHGIPSDGAHAHDVEVGPAGSPDDAPAFLTLLYIIRYA